MVLHNEQIGRSSLIRCANIVNGKPLAKKLPTEVLSEMSDATSLGIGRYDLNNVHEACTISAWFNSEPFAPCVEGATCI